MLIMRPKKAPVIVSTISNDHSLWQDYNEYYHSIDPWNKVLASGKVAFNTCYSGNHYKQYVKDHDYYKTEYFNDFWKPHNLYHSGGGLLVTRDNISIVLAFPREKSAGTYDNHQTQMMTFYGRQIVRAIELEGVFGKSLPQQVYAHALGSSYGLSGAESKLVLELFKNGSLPKASNSLNRSYHTVRNQMKSIFSKTDTSNQLELFRLLVSQH